MLGKWDLPSCPTLSLHGIALMRVSHEKYLGSWIMDPTKDFANPKQQAWSAIPKMKRIWKSNALSRSYLIAIIFRATIDFIPLDHAETCTMTKSLSASLEGRYSTLLRYALNISWNDHINRTFIFTYIKKSLAFQIAFLQIRRLACAGHCFRSSQSALNLHLIFFS